MAPSMCSPEPKHEVEAGRILIVGASIGGIRTAQALRAAGYAAQITVIGSESHFPYDKPPLSKDLLAPDGTGAAVPILRPEEVDALDLDLYLGTTAAALDPIARTVTTQDGQVFAYDRLVIATGVVPHTLPGAGLDGIHTLRNLEDARALRTALTTARHAVVVGAGFIGAEFAAAARSNGVAVTMLEAQAEPLAQALGEAVGARFREFHEAHGVRVITSSLVSEFLGSRRVTGVVANGNTHRADLVVIGIGARPAVEWLRDSGLPLPNGVACDDRHRVVGFPSIYAVGDVAQWEHRFYGTPVRIEHWTNAQDHASAVAADIMGLPAPAPSLPYVWSDQYGRRIQIIGRPSMGSLDSVEGGIHTGDLTALYADAQGNLAAAVVVDDPRLLMRCRKAILQRSNLDEFKASLLAKA